MALASPIARPLLSGQGPAGPNRGADVDPLPQVRVRPRRRKFPFEEASMEP